jgi:hypothetical protein
MVVKVVPGNSRYSTLYGWFRYFKEKQIQKQHTANYLFVHGNYTESADKSNNWDAQE